VVGARKGGATATNAIHRKGEPMASKRLKAYLDENAVKYVSIQHSPAFEASEVAASVHVAGRDFAKTVIVKLDGVPTMVILPATRRLVLQELCEMLDSQHVKLASESEIRGWFPDCEIGAMPPFGNLYNMEVHVAASLAHEPEIAFNAGSHTEVIKLAYGDFERLVKPKVIDFATT
jgi:Ala-tRNA(Pro) deacylase